MPQPGQIKAGSGAIGIADALQAAEKIGSQVASNFSLEASYMRWGQAGLAVSVRAAAP
jgi:hypothetical protein